MKRERSARRRIKIIRDGHNVFVNTTNAYFKTPFRRQTFIFRVRIEVFAAL